MLRCYYNYGVPEALRDRFWALYRDHSFSVKREGQRSAETRTRTGTKQGCLLSPIIYNLVANFVFEYLPREREDGTKAGVAFSAAGLLEGEEASEHVLRDLEFADDTALLEETLEGLERLTEKACSLLKTFGLEVNYTKTEFMIFGGQSENVDAIATTDGSIKRVREFEYLGTILTEDCREERDVENRLKLAQMKSGELSGIFNNPRTPTNLKVKILKAFVLPVAIWGCEAWSLVGSERASLDTWWNKKLRHCLGVTKLDHVRTEEIHQRTGQNSLSRLVEERRLRYYGHVVRMKKRRWGGGQKKDQQEEGASTEPGGENKVNLASLQILDDALHPACVIVVFFHHLLNEQKREDIVRWCRQSQICGWSKAGHPGLIVAMGQRFHEVYDLVKKLRQLRWQTMEIRVELRGTPAWMEDLLEDGFAEGEMRKRLQEWSGSSSSSSSTPPTTAFSSSSSSIGRRVGVGQELKTFRDYNIIDEDRGYEEYADAEDDVDDDD
eukprot:g19775.t1